MAEILAFCEAHSIRITVRNGVPLIDPPKGKARQVAQVLPHLKRKRAEVLAHFDQDVFVPVKRPEATPKAPSEIERLRNLLLVEVFNRARAGAEARIVYMLHASGLAVPVKRPLPKDVIYLAVSGDEEWIPLPRHTVVAS